MVKAERQVAHDWAGAGQGAARAVIVLTQKGLVTTQDYQGAGAVW